MPDNTYGGRAYVDIAGAFRRGAGRARAGYGDYEGATRIDPDNAQTYGALEDGAVQRKERARTGAYNAEMATALQNRDYVGAGNVAERYANPQGVQAAQTAQTQYSSEQRLDAYRSVQRLRGELEALAAMPEGPEKLAAYAQLQQHATALANAPGGNPELASRLFPEQYNPAAIGRASNVLATVSERMLGENLTPEQQAQVDFRRSQLSEIERHNREVERRLAARGSGSGRTSFRPLTPQEAQSFGLPNNGAGYAMGSNGRPVRVTGGQGNGSGIDPTMYRQAQDRARGLRELEGAMANYERLLRNYNPGVGEAFGVGRQVQAIDSAAQILITQLNRSAFELGALAGPDKDIIEGAIGDPTNWRNLMRGGGQGLRDRFAQAMGLVQRKRAEQERELTRIGADAQAVMGDAPDVFDNPGSGDVPADAVAELRSDPSPEAQREFDDIFGEGAAAAALGQ